MSRFHNKQLHLYHSGKKKKKHSINIYMYIYVKAETSHLLLPHFFCTTLLSSNLAFIVATLLLHHIIDHIINLIPTLSFTLQLYFLQHFPIAFTFYLSNPLYLDFTIYLFIIIFFFLSLHFIYYKNLLFSFSFNIHFSHTKKVNTLSLSLSLWIFNSLLHLYFIGK